MSGEAQPQRVFISYTGKDLSDYAEVVRDVLREKQWIAVDFKDWPPSGRPSVRECVERVRGCDYLIVLVAHRYGYVPAADESGGDGHRSIVELEVDAARLAGKPVLPFLVEPEHTWLPQHIETLKNPGVKRALDEFKEELQGGVCKFFTTPEVLKSQLYSALEALEDPRTRPPEVPPVEEYLRQLRRNTSYLWLIGVGEHFEVRLPLGEVYVPLKVYSGGRYAAYEEVHDLATEQELDLSRAISHVRGLGARGVALLGAPGAGKSTAAQWFVWKCSQTGGAKSLTLDSGTVPVHVLLRRTSARGFEGDAQTWLARSLGSSRGRADYDLAAALSDHPLLWVLDGFDEMASAEARQALTQAILACLESRPDDFVILTSRHVAADELEPLKTRFRTLSVRPLGEKDIERFVENWYRVVEAELNGHERFATSVLKGKAEELAELLGESDFRNRRLASMVSNPLLLSIVCVVHLKEVQLPRRRADLYEKCLDVLLTHWVAAKGLSILDKTAVRAVLKPVAWWLHHVVQEHSAEKSLVEAEAAKQLAGLSTRLSIDHDASAFLAQVRQVSGLLVEPEKGHYGFLHASFQEFLAAQYACDRRQASELVRRLGDDWWREVTLLALGMDRPAFAEDFFSALLASAMGEEDAEVASVCFEEALHVPMDIVTKALEDAVGDPAILGGILRLVRHYRDPRLDAICRRLVESGDAHVRKLADEVLLRSQGAQQPIECAVATDDTAGQDSEIEVTLAPGTQRILQPSGIVVVRIPAGSFDMGSEAGRSDERPVHRVDLSAFWMSKYPVTNEEYARFLEQNQSYPEPPYWRDNRINVPQHPVVAVSWTDAMAFCEWAGVSLPTEAQWEYACRGGTTTSFYSGDEVDELKNVAWYLANSGRETRTVGGKEPSPWGLYDMHGNVWEWCVDYYVAYEPRTVIDPRGPVVGDFRVIRGGSCLDGPEKVRSSYRDVELPDRAHFHLGFRIVIGD